ncbi:MAG: hypothetical protein ACK5SX_04760 [Sandaracinobacter sp.]
MSNVAGKTYVKRSPVETTMSFNDYWPGRPPLKGPTINNLILRAAVPAVLAGLIVLLLGGGWWALPAAIAGLALGAWRVVRFLWSTGANEKG